MNGRVWTVTYENAEAMVHGRPVVRCGGAGATWAVESNHDAARLELTLYPIAPHEVDPSQIVQEIVMPSVAR